MKLIKLLSLTLLFSLLTHPAFSQLQNDRFQFDPDLDYRPDVQSPEEFLGYPLGSEYSHHHQLGAYLKHLADVSDRVEVVTYGETYEGRDLWLAIITSEENHGNIEEIRENNLK
ncbi:MAG: M14 family zinc carboxypeptidase, partial [Bacteroidota bacterium]